MTKRTLSTKKQKKEQKIKKKENKTDKYTVMSNYQENLKKNQKLCQ